MTSEHKKAWKCQACYCKTPKIGNPDTPIRPRERDVNDEEYTNSDMNVTTRNKQKRSGYHDDTIHTENLSILGDTIYTENNVKSETSIALTLENLSEIMTLRLKENNKTIISDLQNTIQYEINKAIKHLKEDIYSETKELSMQNIQRKTEIEQIANKINYLTKENNKLKEQIQELMSKIVQPKNDSFQDCSKKIVIYGFPEYHKEFNSDLHDRLLQMFYETLNVDLTGYIEDMHRIGKYGNGNHTRPLVIELLSKQMTKYILNNSHCFRGTNLSISAFLEGTALQDRKAMRDAMLAARKSGLYAIIRNKELYVEGKKVNWKSSTKHENDKLENAKDINFQNLSSNMRSNPQKSFFRRQRTTL